MSRMKILREPSRYLLLAATLLLLHAASVSAATKKPPLKPINLNTANSAQLQEVPGIGPATAEKILQMRKSYGAFKSVDDLLAIRGIGPKRLEKMRKYLSVGKPQGSNGGAQPANCEGCPKPKQKPAPTKTPPPASTDDEEPQLH
jgi:comEA protein